MMQPVSPFNGVPGKRSAQDELEGHHPKRTRTEYSPPSTEQVFTSEPLAPLFPVEEDINMIFARVDQALNSSASDQEILSIVSQYPSFICWICPNSFFLITNAILSSRHTLADWMLQMIKRNSAILRYSPSAPGNIEILLSYTAVKGEWEVFNQILEITQAPEVIYFDDQSCKIGHFTVTQEEYLLLKKQLCLFNLVNFDPFFIPLPLYLTETPSSLNVYLEVALQVLEELGYPEQKFPLDSICWAKFNLKYYLPNQERILYNLAWYLENVVTTEIAKPESSQSPEKKQYIFHILTVLTNLFAFEKAVSLDNDKLAFDLWNKKKFVLDNRIFNILLTKNTLYYRIIISLSILKNEFPSGNLDKNLIRNITEELVNVITNEKINPSPLRRLEMYFGLNLPSLEDDWAAQLSFFCFNNEFHDLYAIVIETFSNMDLTWNYDVNDRIEDSFIGLVNQGNWKLFFELKQRHQVPLEMDKFLLLAAEKKRWGVMQKILSMHPRLDLESLNVVNANDIQKVVPFGFTALSYALAEAEEKSKKARHTALILMFLGAKHALHLGQYQPLDLFTIEQFQPFLLDDPDKETRERLEIYKLSQKRFEQFSKSLNNTINLIRFKVCIYNKHNPLPNEIEKKILANLLKLAFSPLIPLPDEIVVEKGLSFSCFPNCLNENATTHIFNLFAQANEHLFCQYQEEKREFLINKVKYYTKKYFVFFYGARQDKVFSHIFGKKVPKAETEGLKSKTILKNRFKIAVRASEIALEGV